MKRRRRRRPRGYAIRRAVCKKPKARRTKRKKKKKYGKKRKPFQGRRRSLTFPDMTEAQVAKLSDDEIVARLFSRGLLY